MAIAGNFGVSSKSFLNVQREIVVGTPLVGTVTNPWEANDYSLEDTPKFLPDEAIRGVMTPLFNEIRGVEQATFSFGGPAFLDGLGYYIDNTFGDFSSVSNGTLGTTQHLTGTTAVGATTLTVGTSIGAVTAGSVIQISDGAASEIVIATNSSGTTPAFTANPLRFAHGTSATAQLESTAVNYTHTWAILNSGSSQPPTHTLTDWTNLTASVGARSYPSACVSKLDFTGNTEQLLMTKVAGNSWQSAAAGSTPAASTTFVKPQAAWESTITIGGSPVYSINNWTWSADRKLQTYWTSQNSQTPYIIARGGLGITWGLNFAVPADETPLTEMLTSGPLAVVIATSNGLTGANLQSLTLTTTTAQTVKSKPTRSNVLIGYDNSLTAVANATDVGGSGGIGPGTVVVTNAVATY